MLTRDGHSVRVRMPPPRTFADVEYDGQPRQTRRERFLQRMDTLMPWARLEARIRPVYPTGARGRPPYPLALLLRIHCVQLFYNLSDPAMEDALYDSVAVQRFVGLTARGPRPDETTILHFRHLLERHQLGEGLLAEITQHLAAQGLRLREGTIVDATILDAPASTKNRAQARDPEMHQVKKGNQWSVGMKAHIGVDAATGLGHSVAATPANVADITQVPQPPPRRRDARVGRRGLRGRGPAPGAPGPRDRLAGGAAAGPAAALGARQRRGPGGAAQGLNSGEGRASVPIREAALRLRPRAVSRVGQEPHPAVPAVWARQPLAGGPRRARVSGRSAPCVRAPVANTAAHEASQPDKAVNPTPHGARPPLRRSGTLVIQRFPRVSSACRSKRRPCAVATIGSTAVLTLKPAAPKHPSGRCPRRHSPVHPFRPNRTRPNVNFHRKLGDPTM